MTYMLSSAWLMELQSMEEALTLVSVIGINGAH